MVKRIIQIREEANLSQEKFAEKLGLSRNFINQVENGKKNISDRTTNDICKKFNINEDWLLNGNGDMHVSQNGTLTNYLSELAYGDDDFIKDLIVTYMELDETSKEAIRVLAKKMAEKQNNRGQD